MWQVGLQDPGQRYMQLESSYVRTHPFPYLPPGKLHSWNLDMTLSLKTLPVEDSSYRSSQCDFPCMPLARGKNMCAHVHVWKTLSFAREALKMHHGNSWFVEELESFWSWHTTGN